MHDPRESPNGQSFRRGRTAALFVLLFVIAIPWWWQFAPTIGERVTLGAPLWFITSIAGSIVVSAVSARYLALAWAASDEEGLDPRGDDE